MKEKLIIGAVLVLTVGAGFFGYFWAGRSGITSRSIGEVQAQNDGETFSAATSTTGQATIQFFGDIMLDRIVAKTMSTSGLDYIFQKTKGTDFFWNADLTVANLEGPFAPVRIKTSKSIAFRFDPALAPQLKKYGFGLLDLANNHALDMGRANLTFTKKTLSAAGLNYFGDQLREGSAYAWIGVAGGYKIAFIGLNNTDHVLDMAKVESAISEAKKSADYVIIFMHWGNEYKQKSNKAQQSIAHWLIDKGADAIIGGHPHVVEEMEIYNGKPIFYSLGNFIFDQYFSKETQEGISVGLTFGENGVSQINIFPFYSVKSQPQLMIGNQKDDFMKWFETNSRIGNLKFNDNILNLK